MADWTDRQLGGCESARWADQYFHRTVFPSTSSRNRSAAPTTTSRSSRSGHYRNRLFRDETEFIAFPFYSKTRKRDDHAKLRLSLLPPAVGGSGADRMAPRPPLRDPDPRGDGGQGLPRGPDRHPASSSWLVRWPLIGHQHAELVQTNERVQQARLSVLPRPFAEPGPHYVRQHPGASFMRPCGLRP